MTETSGREKVLEPLWKPRVDQLRADLEAGRYAGNTYNLCSELIRYIDAALASPSTQESALRGGKVEEIARIELAFRKALSFKDAEWVLAALRTFAGESAAQSERAREASEAEVDAAFKAYEAEEYNGGTGFDCIRAALSAARKAGGE